MHKLFLIQTLLSVSIAGYFALTGDLPAAIAAVYGGGIALVNAFLAWRRIAKAQKMLVQDGKAIVRSFYIGAIERFVFALVAMAAGMGWLKLDPIALLITFGVCQIAYATAAPKPDFSQSRPSDA